MADANERELFAQQERDFRELYPTDAAWENRYPPLMPPDNPELRQQYDDHAQMARDSGLDRALRQSETSTEISARRQRDLDTHDRLVLRGAADASRDVLPDNGPGKEPGAYTTHEARDRAAHTPPAHTLEPEK